MSTADVVERLAELPSLRGMPRDELEWLATRGRLEVREAGSVLAPRGLPVDRLWVILSGRVTVRVDRGKGARRVISWGPGEVSGMLPYSRMTGPPGDNFAEVPTEALAVHVRHFAEMVRDCPAFTAHTVHLMLDRARRFNASDLQDEKMVALGKLAAGLAHELNNPASATLRGAKQLREALGEIDASARALGASGLDEDRMSVLEDVRDACAESPEAPLSPIELADREDELADWLESHGADPGLAASLAGSGVTPARLEELEGRLPAGDLAPALRWIAAGQAADSLVQDVENAADRIHELVAAVKRFTWMDELAAPEAVDVEAGIRDTLRMMASKVRSTGAALAVDAEPDLPRARAVGSELNQVWMNLLDNALDAVPENGRIDVSLRRELDRIVVRVANDGPEIAPDVMARMFDPFFTTKGPGEGTGLGLDTVRRLVRRSRGEVVAESLPGRTTFTVSLPVEGVAG